MNLLVVLLEWLRRPETWQGSGSIPVRLAEHIGYSTLALLIAVALALPLGIWLGHIDRGRVLVLTIANSVRALPTLGLITLVVVLIGVGLLPPLIALVILAAPPILVNAFEGMRGVDPAVRDAARGIGLDPRRMALGVELPIALPTILLGLRVGAIQVVSTATVASFVGLGGLGRYIFDGLGQRDLGQVIGGSVLVALLAIATEGGFLLLSRYLVPAGVRAARSPGRRRGRRRPSPDDVSTRAIATTTAEGTTHS